MINQYNRTSKDGVVLPISIPSVRSLVAWSAVEYPAPGRQVLLTIKLNQLFSSALENVHREWLFQRMMAKKRGRGTDGREEIGDVAGVVVRYQMAESGG
jgi:hypothetical protein